MKLFAGLDVLLKALGGVTVIAQLVGCLHCRQPTQVQFPAPFEHPKQD